MWEKHQAVACIENTRLWTDLLLFKEKLFGGWSRKMWACRPVFSTSFSYNAALVVLTCSACQGSTANCRER